MYFALCSPAPEKKFLPLPKREVSAGEKIAPIALTPILATRYGITSPLFSRKYTLISLRISKKHKTSYNFPITSFKRV